MDKIRKSIVLLEIANLDGSVDGDKIEKARNVKYYRREGSPGHYKYYYTKEGYDKAKGVKKEEATKRLDNLNVARAMEVANFEKEDPRGGVYNSPEFRTADKVSRLLKLRGIEKPFSVSETNFGRSMYFTVRGENNEPKLKIRISDHGVTNIDRIFGEQHETSKSNPVRIADVIEREMFPERYKKIQTGVNYYSKYNNQLITTDVKNGETWISEKREMNEKELNNLPKETTRVLSKEFVRESKTGNKIYNVEFERKHFVVEKPIYRYERKEKSPVLKEYTPK